MVTELSTVKTSHIFCRQLIRPWWRWSYNNQQLTVSLIYWALILC